MAEMTAIQQDNRAVLNSWLGQFNLGSLEGTITDWIIKNYSPERIKLEITNTQPFKDEFPEYQAAIQAGTPMSPAEIMSYRQTVNTLFKDYGLPAGFYDEKSDYVDLISKKLSPGELQTRVEQGYTRVAGAPQEVKDVFNQYFGIQGESYMATFFLDPERGSKFLQDAATQAEIGGAGQQYGFNLSQTQAERYQQMGIGGQQARQAFQQAYQLRPLEEETMAEGEDINRQQVGEAALTGGEQERRLQRRQQERSAAFAGSGGAGAGRTGLGLGGT